MSENEVIHEYYEVEILGECDGDLRWVTTIVNAYPEVLKLLEDFKEYKVTHLYIVLKESTSYLSLHKVSNSNNIEET